jgi:hypothetical protein
MNTARYSLFRKWWKRNHHHQPGHKWLVKHSKRILHNYNIAPEQFDYCKSLHKRWNLSEYKRLNYTDAYFLWRLTHPSMNARRERLLATSIYFEEQRKLVDRKFSK